MSWLNRWVLAIAPSALAALRMYLETNPGAREKYRKVCVEIVAISNLIELLFIEDAEFQEDVINTQTRS